MEEWRDVVGYEGLYQVSSEGRVKSLPRGRVDKRSGEIVLSVRHTGYGYKAVHLYKDGIHSYPVIHRLVATAFIPNPDNLPVVNHIDENKHNNCASNLEWCTQKHNANHGTRNFRMGRSKSRPVQQLTRDGELVADYYSVCEAARATGISQSSISMVCMGKLNAAGGFKWRYKEMME